MPLKVYNSFTNKKEIFNSIEPNKVKMYCCGVTVYDDCHLGHARTCLIWDVVRCYLEWKGNEVFYVQNFTDIDDKIISKALTERVSIQDITSRYIISFFNDMDALGVRRANLYPKATQVIDRIKVIIDDLLERKLAYKVGEDIYFSVDKFKDYGLLSNRNLEDLLIGRSNRITDAELDKKLNPLDFILWKGSNDNSTPYFIFEWGAGRPGWHIECSAIINKYMGDTIDIHVGGNDLIFPHHENEIAQSTSYTNKPLANYWLHNGMVRIDSQKMSKSLGNFFPIKNYLNLYSPQAIRLFILQTHYGKPLDYSARALDSCTAAWKELNKSLSYAIDICQAESNTDLHEESIANFTKAMDDNFNTPQALSIIFDLSKRITKEHNLILHQGKSDLPKDTLIQLSNTLLNIIKPLGIVSSEEILDTQQESSLSNSEIDKLISRREDARSINNYAEADSIRDLLFSKGINLIDTQEGTKWYR